MCILCARLESSAGSLRCLCRQQQLDQQVLGALPETGSVPVQGRVADQAAIQFRMLNMSKGPAVHGPRAQMDRTLYKTAMQRAIAQQERLAVHDGAVSSLLLERVAPEAAAAYSEGATNAGAGSSINVCYSRVP